MPGELVVEQAEGGIAAAHREEVAAEADEEGDAVREAGDHVEPRRVPGDDRPAQLALGGEAVGRGARHPNPVDGAVEGNGVGAELAGQRLEEAPPADGVEARIGDHQPLGRGALRVGLRLREHLVDRLGDAGHVTGREPRLHDQVAGAAQGAEQPAEGTAPGGFGHPSSTPDPERAP